MAYQNVGTPRFFVSALQWLKSQGLLSDAGGSGFTTLGGSNKKSRFDMVDIDPTRQVRFKRDNTTDNDQVQLRQYNIKGSIVWADVMPNDKNFSMWLGHNFGNGVDILTKEVETGGSWVTTAGYLNYKYSGTQDAEYNGFSIGTGNNGGDINGSKIGLFFGTESNPFMHNDEGWAGVELRLGSYLYGTYFTVPHSPDLKLTMTREQGGFKKTRTRGGNDLTDHQYTTPPLWGESAPWELNTNTGAWSDAPQNLSRSGRRIWDLSFSYLQDSNVFSEISNLSWYEAYDNGTSYTDTIETWNKTLLKDDNFYSQVIHKTNGGQLPFVFQPDYTNKNPDGFAIAKFDMNSFQFDQVANGVYNIKLKIREVW